MITKDHLEVFHFLEKNGCRFQKHKQLIDLFYWPNWDSGFFKDKDTSDEIPINVNIKKLFLQHDYDVQTLIFLIKYTNNDDLIALKTDKIFQRKNGILYMLTQNGNQNIVDILLIYDQYQEILDLYKKLNHILLPISFTIKQFKEMIDNSFIQELKDIISNIS